MYSKLLSLHVVLVASGCIDSADLQQVSASRHHVLYGHDDRIEPHELDRRRFETLLSRTVALVPVEESAAAVVPVDLEGTSWTIEASEVASAGEQFELCSDERFAAQPSLAACSGVLVSPDVVLTAGHCFDEGESCDKYLYALSYAIVSSDEGVSTALHLAACTEMIVREVGILAGGGTVDYALLQLALDAEADGPDIRAPIQPLMVDDAVEVVGFPLGVPLKVDMGARLLAVGRAGFSLQTDAYRGSSGSAVYDANGALAGILVRGEADFEWDGDEGCNRSRVIDRRDDEAYESGMHAWLALARACHRAPELSFCAGLPRDGAIEAESVAMDDGAASDAKRVEGPSCTVRRVGSARDGWLVLLTLAGAGRFAARRKRVSRYAQRAGPISARTCS